MLRINRTITATLVAIPLAATLATPSMAAPPTKYTEQGDHVEASGTLLGTLEGLEGNVHLISISGDRNQDGAWGYGSVESYACPAGVTDPWSDEDNPVCDSVGWSELESDDLRITIAKKLATGTVNGTFTPVTWDCDEVDCWPTYGPALDVALKVTSTAKKATTYRSTEFYRDPDTGAMYRGTLVQHSTLGDASGTVGGAQLTNAWGLVGTFTFRAMEKV